MTDLQDTQRQLEEENDNLKKLLKSSEKMNKDMIDEHDALNAAFNSLQKKLKQTESENDRLVSMKPSSQYDTGAYVTSVAWSLVHNMMLDFT